MSDKSLHEAGRVATVGSSYDQTTPRALAADEWPDFVQFNLPAWLTHDEVAELQRLANVHLAGLLAAHRVAAAVRGALSAGDAQPGGIDEVADVLGIEVEELRALLMGAAPGFTVQQLATVAALVGRPVSSFLAAADDECPVYSVVLSGIEARR